MLHEVLGLVREAGRKVMAIYDAGDAGSECKADGSPLRGVRISRYGQFAQVVSGG